MSGLTTFRNNQAWAIRAAKAVPGVRWTIEIPEARTTFWIDRTNKLVQRIRYGEEIAIEK